MDLKAMREMERRKSPRVELRVSVLVKWTAPNGARREEVADTEVVSAVGCQLALRTPVLENTRVDVVNLATKVACPGRVVWCGPDGGDHRSKVAIDFDEADTTFWGPPYQEACSRTQLYDTWVG